MRSIKLKTFWKIAVCLFLLSATSFFITSCSTRSSDICLIINNPYDYQNQMTIAGKVTASANRYGYTWYEIRGTSDSCKLLVVSTRISPPVGKIHRASGKLKELSNKDNKRSLLFIETGVDFSKIEKVAYLLNDVFN